MIGQSVAVHAALATLSFLLLIAASVYAVTVIWTRSDEGRLMAAGGGLFLLNTFAMGVAAASENLAIALAAVAVQIMGSVAILRAA